MFKESQHEIQTDFSSGLIVNESFVHIIPKEKNALTSTSDTLLIHSTSDTF